MRIGIISDIHGNSDALNAVMSKAEILGIEKFLVAGDLVGYYYNIKEVIEILLSKNCSIIKGNHEIIFEKCLNTELSIEEITKKYGSGIKHAINSLDNREKDFLLGLPETLQLNIGGVNFFLCHGSKDSPYEYIYPDENLEIVREKLLVPGNVVIFGNTHYPSLFSYDDCTIINPGSVGQPRNKDKGAHWAIYNTRTKKIEFRKESYDETQLLMDIEANDPENSYLSEVLLRT